LNQNQTDAVIGLMFNIGSINFKNSSVLRHINNQDFNKVADAFLYWCKVRGKTVNALYRRRQDERAMFLKPKNAYDLKPPPAMQVEAKKECLCN
jgi:lysozyme